MPGRSRTQDPSHGSPMLDPLSQPWPTCMYAHDAFMQCIFWNELQLPSLLASDNGFLTTSPYKVILSSILNLFSGCSTSAYCDNKGECIFDEAGFQVCMWVSARTKSSFQRNLVDVSSIYLGVRVEVNLWECIQGALDEDRFLQPVISQ